MIVARAAPLPVAIDAVGRCRRGEADHLGRVRKAKRLTRGKTVRLAPIRTGTCQLVIGPVLAIGLNLNQRPLSVCL